MNIDRQMTMEKLKKIGIKLVWMLAVIAVCALVYGVTAHYETSHPVLCKVIDKIAEIIAIGVIWGLIVDGGKIIGAIREELTEIVDCEDYLKRRTDINKIWKNATKALLNDKFPEIQDDLMETIKKYMVKERVCYYEEYNVTTSIKMIDKKRKIIRVTDVVEFRLKTDDENEFIHPIKAWTTVKDIRDYKCDIRQLEVNETDVKKKVAENEIKKDNGEICKEWRLPLQGSTSYTIKYKRETEYDIHDDYSVGLKAAYIVNNMSVDLTLPDGLEATFKSRGTQEDFTPVINEKKRIKMKYRGIILPHQGYIFALRT